MRMYAGVAIEITANIRAVGGFNAIVDGSFNVTGAAIDAPLSTLSFPGTATNGFFVNGVESQITSGAAGFFSGGLPAVLNTNLIVTYGAAPINVVVGQVRFDLNQVIQATSFVIDPMAGDQAGAGLGAALRLQRSELNAEDPAAAGERRPAQCS